MEIGDKVGQFIYMGKDEARNQHEIERVKNGEIKNPAQYFLWKCKCGNIISRQKHPIEHEIIISCGCSPRPRPRKLNQYEFFDDYVIGHFNGRKEIFYIDLEDYEKVSQYTWFYHKNGYAYAERDDFEDGKRRKFYMHRFIMGDKDEEYDHKDRNGLNNRKENLRPATHLQNSWNILRDKSNDRHPVIGVIFPQKETWKWRAFIRVDGQYHYLGAFLTENEAIIARLKAEKEYYGDFAPQHHLFEQYNIL